MLSIDVRSLVVCNEGDGDERWKSDFAAGKAIVTGMQAIFEANKVDVSPLLVLRTEDVVASYLLARGVDEALRSIGVYKRNTEDAPDLSGALLPAVDASHKARERLRKAMRELEEACSRAGTPIDLGLPGRMKPLVEAAEGVLEDAAAFEEKKRKRAEARKQKAASVPPASANGAAAKPATRTRRAGISRGNRETAP